MIAIFPISSSPYLGDSRDGFVFMVQCLNLLYLNIFSDNLHVLVFDRDVSNSVTIIISNDYVTPYGGPMAHVFADPLRPAVIHVAWKLFILI